MCISKKVEVAYLFTILFFEYLFLGVLFSLIKVLIALAKRIIVFTRGKPVKDKPTPRPVSYVSLTSGPDLEAQLNLLDEHGVGRELPVSAKERLLIMSGQSGDIPLFTSNLSVNEFLLIKEAGFEPLGLVMGSSIYSFSLLFRYGTNYNYNQSFERENITKARYTARELAMARMMAEAKVLKADGIIGVRLTVKDHAWGTDMAEFMAIGTAIRATGTKPYPINKDKPFTSDFSGQNFWTLLQADYFPLGLVMGNCVYYSPDSNHIFSAEDRSEYGQRERNTYSFYKRQVGSRNLKRKNFEMTRCTDTLYKAKVLALERMEADATAHRAEGVVGSQVDIHHLTEDTIEYFSIGTAIRSISDDHRITKPTMTYNTNI